MIANGRNLMFIISLAEMTLSHNDPLSEESEFLDYLFNLHNAARIKHRVKILSRDDDVSKIRDYIYFLYK